LPYRCPGFIQRRMGLPVNFLSPACDLFSETPAASGSTSAEARPRYFSNRSAGACANPHWPARALYVLSATISGTLNYGPACKGLSGQVGGIFHRLRITKALQLCAVISVSYSL
jgi:hypothetical protein